MRGIHWLIIAILLCIGVFLFMPVYSGGHAAPTTACLSNVKQLATATAIYQTGYDDRLPPNGWADEMMPYIKNEDMFTCPAVAKEKRAKYGYAMNFAVMGLNVAKMKGDPAKTVLFFETDALGRGVVANLAARNDDRHKRSDGTARSNVAYIDTHAKMIPKGQTP